MKVAVLGLGSMGRAFGTRAAGAGHDVVGWNRTPGRGGGLTEAGTPAEAVAGADVVLVVVADGAAVTAVCDAELLGALSPQAILAVVSTVAPATVREIRGLAAALETAGGLAESGAATGSAETAASTGSAETGASSGLADRVLDTPVLGAPSGIDAGQGRFFVGGTDSAVAAIAPLLADLGAGYTHCGPLGAGAVMKIVSNLQLIIGVAAMAEAIATARGHGLDDALVRTVLADSAVVSPTSRLRLPNVLDPAHPGWFPPTLAAKDVRLALDLAAEAGLTTALGPAAAELLERVADQDWPDFAAVIEGLDP